MLKKVVISPSSNHKAIAFFEEMKSKKEEAKKKIEVRTLEIKEFIKQSVSAK